MWMLEAGSHTATMVPSSTSGRLPAYVTAQNLLDLI